MHPREPAILPVARPGCTPRSARRPALPLLLCALLLAGCAASPTPQGELFHILDDQHRIANPGKIGASATGEACGLTEKEALTSARRVAHFNLRELTGQARYTVRYDPLRTTQTPQGVCVEVSALAMEPRPFER